MTYHNAQYLGDGVYVQRDEFNNLWLSTAGHIGSGQEENKICLEDDVEKALLHRMQQDHPAPPVKVVEGPELPDTLSSAKFATIEVTRLQLGVNWVAENQDTILHLGLNPMPMSSGFVDFDNLSREKVLEVIKAFGGKWVKEVNGGRMNYVLWLDSGIALRMYNAALPPSCKLVKKLMTIPEHVEERMEIQCPTKETEP